MTLVYDGTFEGFLSLVYEVYYQKIQPSKILKSFPEELLLDKLVSIEYQEEKSSKVLEALEEKFDKKYLENIFHSFMCDSVSFELDLLHYIIIGFKNQRELENINHPCVFAIQNLLKEFFRHNHKMSGFIRFIELEDGTLYAKIETKFNIVSLLGKHFLQRFNTQNYIIHDIKRELAFIKNNDFVGIQQVSSFEEPKTSADEEKFSKLWSKFFQSVAIQSRENPKLQRQMVPLLYRTYMTEFLK